MISFFSNILKKIKKISPSVLPGQIYTFDGSDKNPFSKTNNTEAEVKAVKDGYVNYKILPDTGVFNNESMKESTFKSIYTLKP